MLHRRLGRRSHVNVSTLRYGTAPRAARHVWTTLSVYTDHRYTLGHVSGHVYAVKEARDGNDGNGEQQQ